MICVIWCGACMNLFVLFLGKQLLLLQTLVKDVPASKKKQEHESRSKFVGSALHEASDLRVSGCLKTYTLEN